MCCRPGSPLLVGHLNFGLDIHFHSVFIQAAPSLYLEVMDHSWSYLHIPPLLTLKFSPILQRCLHETSYTFSSRRLLLTWVSIRFDIEALTCSYDTTSTKRLTAWTQSSPTTGRQLLLTWADIRFGVESPTFLQSSFHRLTDTSNSRLFKAFKTAFVLCLIAEQPSALSSPDRTLLHSTLNIRANTSKSRQHVKLPTTPRSRKKLGKLS